MNKRRISTDPESVIATIVMLVFAVPLTAMLFGVSKLFVITLLTGLYYLLNINPNKQILHDDGYTADDGADISDSEYSSDDDKYLPKLRHKNEVIFNQNMLTQFNNNDKTSEKPSLSATTNEDLSTTLMRKHRKSNSF